MTAPRLAVVVGSGSVKCAAAVGLWRVLQREGIDFMVGGGLAAWAHGGPPTTWDVDLMLRPDDAEAASAALGETGMRLEDPPELGDVRLQRRRHAGRRGVLPEQVDDGVHRDRPPARQGKGRDQRALLRRTEVDGRSAQAHLDRTEDRHLHGPSVESAGPARSKSAQSGFQVLPVRVVPPITDQGAHPA